MGRRLSCVSRHVAIVSICRFSLSLFTFKIVRSETNKKSNKKVKQKSIKSTRFFLLYNRQFRQFGISTWSRANQRRIRLVMIAPFRPQKCSKNGEFSQNCELSFVARRFFSFSVQNSAAHFWRRCCTSSSPFSLAGWWWRSIF